MEYLSGFFLFCFVSFICVSYLHAIFWSIFENRPFHGFILSNTTSFKLSDTKNLQQTPYCLGEFSIPKMELLRKKHVNKVLGKR